jgi:glucokinase-like ROK family protein
MTSPTVADQGLIRKLNTAVILDILRRLAPLSRAELAARTGLNRSTVSIIVNSLIEEGFIQETDLQSARVGRPGMLLVLNPRGGCAVGVEIGVDFISVVLTDFVAQVLWNQRIPSNPADSQIALLERATDLTQQALERGVALGLRPLGVGLGVPGLVDIHQSNLIFAPNLHWHNVPLRVMWTERFDLPVFVENDGNAAALGEYYFGVARGVEDFIYLSAGVGLGGGIVLGGKLFRGSTGYASEVGHMTVMPDGELCGCGKRGCWETLVSPGAVARFVRRRIEAGEHSMIQEMAGNDLNGINFDLVLKGAQNNDPLALSALHENACHMGIGIANLVNVFNPQLVVIGGELSRASKFLLPTIKEVACQNALRESCENLQIAASAHGEEACLMGAIALVLDDILREPMLI